MAYIVGVVSATREFSIMVLGRTLEHLGAQMYKRRDTAIAELVANSWDAGATEVSVEIPETAYDRDTDPITITDNGVGMSADQVQADYLVVGRNRRMAGASENPVADRPIMGRKGIGKLAGFGIARQMDVSTWQAGAATEFTMNMDELKRDSGVVDDVAIIASVDTKPPISTESGTRLVLTHLKHETPLSADTLRESLARRFARTTRGEMVIKVNGVPVGDPTIDYEIKHPADGGTASEEIGTGARVDYSYGFSSSPIRSTLLRGFAIYVNGKVAQAPPFYFNVEGTASGQHGTRYLSGEINADFLDEGDDDESDIVSTDRQEIDWESTAAKELKDWGETLTRRILREWADRRGDSVKNKVLDDPDIKVRIENLDAPSRAQISKYLTSLGQSEVEPERALELADKLVMAFEYRHFHDVINDIETASEDPDELRDMLEKIAQWKVLESRAILEVINGRLLILSKFNTTLVQNIPETAPAVGAENLHDLIANYPWLIDPDWQILEEERSVSALLRQWHNESDEDDKSRIDFLGLTGNGEILVIEIKRAGHTVSRENVRRLEDYTVRIRRSYPKARPVFISGDSYEEHLKEDWNPVIQRLTWSEVHKRTSAYYEHYRALLEGDVTSTSFSRKQTEVNLTRSVLDVGAYREKGPAKPPLGPQDADYPLPETSVSSQGERSGQAEDDSTSNPTA